MRAFIRNYIQSESARREETGEKGFSLIELIIVVVILGILAAIAIPIFLNIQQDARNNALEAIAANGATQASAALAQDEDPQAAGFFDNLNADEDGDGTNDVTLALDASFVAGDVDSVCVVATRGTETAESGPGC